MYLKIIGIMKNKINIDTKRTLLKSILSCLKNINAKQIAYKRMLIINNILPLFSIEVFIVIVLKSKPHYRSVANNFTCTFKAYSVGN